jgi:2-dehydropantoate 2-reductase
MKILIWGAGAIGGTIGAYLTLAGYDVTMVDREADHVDVINEEGLSIVGPIDEFVVRVPAFTLDSITGEYDVILLCVKAQDTESAAQALAPHRTADGYVVSVQNGLNELVIADIIGRERTVGSFVNFGGDYMEPGVIHFGGRGAVVFGELEGSSTLRIHTFHESFSTFEPKAIFTDNRSPIREGADTF